MKKILGWILLGMYSAYSFAQTTGAPQPNAPTAAATSSVAIPSGAAAAATSAKATCAQCAVDPMPEWLIVTLMLAVFVLTLLGILRVMKALTKESPDWKLSEALSEEAQTTKPDPADPSKQVQVTHLAASSSRLIAFLGLIVILVLFFGIGETVLWLLGRTGCFPDLNGATTFLFAGASLFVPYSVNQLRSAFEAFGK